MKKKVQKNVRTPRLATRTSINLFATYSVVHKLAFTDNRVNHSVAISALSCATGRRSDDVSPLSCALPLTQCYRERT